MSDSRSSSEILGARPGSVQPTLHTNWRSWSPVYSSTAGVVKATSYQLEQLESSLLQYSWSGQSHFRPTGAAGVQSTPVQLVWSKPLQTSWNSWSPVYSSTAGVVKAISYQLEQLHPSLLQYSWSGQSMLSDSREGCLLGLIDR